jgi:hypothetical protein
VDVHVRSRSTQAPANPIDQHLDGVRGKILSEGLDRVFNGPFWHYPAGPPHQQRQSIQLPAAELYWDAINGHLPVARIERNVAHDESDAKRHPACATRRERAQ